MKTLYINRHAKSSWNDHSIKDFDRPLNPRGKRDAPEMAKRFLIREGKVDVLISSPAKRALSTATAFSKELGDKKIHYNENIYEASVSDLLEVVNGINKYDDSAILFGHNPGFSAFVDYLCDENIYLPTCGIVKINFNVDTWQEVGVGIGEFVYFDYPKNKDR